MCLKARTVNYTNVNAFHHVCVKNMHLHMDTQMKLHIVSFFAHFTFSQCMTNISAIRYLACISQLCCADPDRLTWKGVLLIPSNILIAGVTSHATPHVPLFFSVQKLKQLFYRYSRRLEHSSSSLASRARRKVSCGILARWLSCVPPASLWCAIVATSAPACKSSPKTDISLRKLPLGEFHTLFHGLFLHTKCFTGTSTLLLA